jgi:hypothetical protein
MSFSSEIYQNVEDQDIQNNFASFTHGCEKWFLTFEEGYKLQVFGKKIRKIFRSTKYELNEQFRILHNEELSDMYMPAGLVLAGVA